MAGKQRSVGRATQDVCLLGLMLCMVLSVRSLSEDEDGEEGNSKLAMVIEYHAPNLYPEGFDWDARHSRFLVGSSTQGKLVTLTEQGIVEDFVIDKDYAGRAAVLGVTVDSIHNRVLVVLRSGRFMGGPSVAGLVAYDLDSKERTQYVNFTAQGGEAPGKFVAVDRAGNAYLTSSDGNSVWKVTSEGLKTVLVAAIPRLPLLVEEVEGLNSNGIAHHDDGYLLVSQMNSGALVRVNLEDNQVRAVKMKDGVLIPGADALAFRSDGSLVVISVDNAWVVASRDAWRSATVIEQVALDVADLTTTVAVNELRTFILPGHFLESSKGLKNRDSFKILEIQFTSDSYNNPLWLLLIVALFAVLVLAWNFQLNQFDKLYNKKRL